MWIEAAEANMRAFDSSMRWVDEKGWSLEDLNSHNYGHLLQFANYAYLQAGLLSEASEIRERVRSDYFASGMAPEIEAPFADVHARWVLDLEQWEEAEPLAAMAREYSINDPGLWLAIGIAAVQMDNTELAVEAMERLDGQSANPSAQSTIAARQVDGLLHLGMGHTEIALGILKDAVELNWEQPGLLIGSPPRPVKPVLEVYGEALLEAGQAEQALAIFQRGLTRYRERTNLLLGAARAAEQLGRRDLSERYYSLLAESWSDAEDGHPFVDEVRN
jgi:tetratricopeptide (TPR) repeat protein